MAAALTLPCVAVRFLAGFATCIRNDYGHRSKTPYQDYFPSEGSHGSTHCGVDQRAVQFGKKVSPCGVVYGIVCGVGFSVVCGILCGVVHGVVLQATCCVSRYYHARQQRAFSALQNPTVVNLLARKYRELEDNEKKGSYEEQYNKLVISNPQQDSDPDFKVGHNRGVACMMQEYVLLVRPLSPP